MQAAPGKIVEMLSEKIIWLELQPNSKLSISELSTETGVSRTPIKEALTNLEANGWVQREEKKFIVAPLTLQLLKEIIEVRSVLEIQAYLWALRRITAKEEKKLSTYKEKIRSLNTESPIKEIMKLDIDIHLFFFKAAKNKYVYSLLERSIYHALRFWLSMHLKSEGLLEDMDEMIDAVEKRDEEKLKRASLSHIKNWADRIIGLY
jgi:DNA-binding GntR family transcriptional regulator